MCIACELGYFAMIDALEAERAAKAETARANEPGFVCDAPTDPSKRRTSEAIVDEPAP
jgi:hypothetical protein